ncbi:MAG: hypothetical protein Q7K40_03560 [bacterium]|nr:hypothetical protein [bacterium]
MKILKTPEQKLLDEKVASSLPFTVEIECLGVNYWNTWGGNTNSPCGAILEVLESDIRWYGYDHGFYLDGEHDAGFVWYVHCAHCGKPIVLRDSNGHNVVSRIPKWIAEKVFQMCSNPEYPMKAEIPVSA